MRFNFSIKLSSHYAESNFNDQRDHSKGLANPDALNSIFNSPKDFLKKYFIKCFLSYRFYFGKQKDPPSFYPLIKARWERKRK